MAEYKIVSTTNYSAFNTVTGNRQVRSAHVKKLKLAMAKDPSSIKYTPILVNDKMEVIDGQHRLEAIKQLELPVFYVKVDGLKLEDVQKLNSISKQWQPMDYAEAFSKLGNQNYAKYVEIKRNKELSLNHDSLMRYLSLDNPITSQSFNEGRLVVPNYARSVELLTQLKELGAFYPRYHIRSSALAFLRLASEEQYDHKRMISQMRKYANSKMVDYSKEVDYFKAYNGIYNWQKATKNKVHFGTPEYLQQN